MSAYFRVLQPGISTTIQDRGRFGAQALGVPVSGAMDPEMLRLANALVGNSPWEAALEIVHAGPVLEVEAQTVRIALAALGGVLTVNGPETRTIPPWRGVTLKKGDRLRIAATGMAVCAYLAVEGGFDVPPVMGSLSTYVRGRIGGLNGRALIAGDRLAIKRERASERPDMVFPKPPTFESGPLRVVPGPQSDRFQPEAFDILCGSVYVVGRAADRMGLRLEGPEIPHRDGHDIVSDGIATGAIQVPGDRRPVLLLPDRQTVGGYPKIGTVCSADLPRAGRLRTGDKVRFAPISAAAAQALVRRRHVEIEALAASLTPAGDGGLDLNALYLSNLVSGVVSGDEPDDVGASG